MKNTKNQKYKDFRHKNRSDLQCFLWEKFLDKFPFPDSRKLLNSLLSSYEKKIITRRLAVLSLIQEGVGTNEIGRLLWLSRSTVSAIRKSFLGKESGYDSARLSNLKKKTITSAISSNLRFPKGLLRGVSILEILKNPPRPRGLGVTGRESHA